MQLRTHLMILWYYVPVQWHPEIMRSSGTYEKQCQKIWQTSLTEPSTHDCLLLWSISTTQLLLPLDWVALWCPLPLLSPCARYCYREELWGPGTMNETYDTLLMSHVPSSGSTLQGAPLKHLLPAWRLTKLYLLWDNSLCLTIHQSHTHLRGIGWHNSHAMHEKKGYLRDMYTLIQLVTSGTDLHSRALCPTQTHFVKPSWQSIYEVCRPLI